MTAKQLGSPIVTITMNTAMIFKNGGRQQTTTIIGLIGCATQLKLAQPENSKFLKLLFQNVNTIQVGQNQFSKNGNDYWMDHVVDYVLKLFQSDNQM